MIKVDGVWCLCCRAHSLPPGLFGLGAEFTVAGIMQVLELSSGWYIKSWPSFGQCCDNFPSVYWPEHGVKGREAPCCRGCSLLLGEQRCLKHSVQWGRATCYFQCIFSWEIGISLSCSYTKYSFSTSHWKSLTIRFEDPQCAGLFLTAKGEAENVEALMN